MSNLNTYLAELDRSAFRLQYLVQHGAPEFLLQKEVTLIVKISVYMVLRLACLYSRKLFRRGD